MLQLCEIDQEGQFDVGLFAAFVLKHVSVKRFYS